MDDTDSTLTARQTAINHLREAARAHPLLLTLIAYPPTYEYTIELPNGGNYTGEEGKQP